MVETVSEQVPSPESPWGSGKPIAVYIHTPFCPSKCGYCDFNSYAMSGEIMVRTSRATCEEIRRSPLAGRPAKTIFFGGGTPTFLETEQLLSILKTVIEVHPPVLGCEISSEANPGTADSDKFSAMRAAGFNRLSLGAQSFVESDLVALGRVHAGSEISRAVRLAREVGFDNLNLDLMFALPNQSQRAWTENLRQAVALDPEHLSLYCLTIESNTPFQKLFLRGDLPLPGEDEQVEMYEQSIRIAEEAGYDFYEISNFAKPDRQCQHNLCYWRGEEYAGYGPGAVSLREIELGIRQRATNLKHPERYCAALEAHQDSFYETEPIDEDTQRTERLMLGLRLVEGVHHSLAAPQAIKPLVDRGWLLIEGDRMRLTPVGRHFHNEVVVGLM
ncbi:MAG: radical SAM family heme chaperone HemW [Fimbriimonadaceae bacterium]